MNVKKGTIVTMQKEKGYGFIEPEEGTRNIFFHTKGLFGVKFKELEIGDKVEFLIIDTDKGPEAIDVSRITN